MGFKRFYRQFTDDLSRRFDTDLQLSPSVISDDVQLVTQLDKKRSLKFNIYQTATATAGNFNMGFLDNIDLIRLLRSLEPDAVSLYDKTPYATLTVNKANLVVGDTGATGFQLNRAGFMLAQTLPGSFNTTQIILFNNVLGVNTQYQSGFKGTDGTANVFVGASLIDPFSIVLKARNTATDTAVNLSPFNLAVHGGFNVTMTYDAVLTAELTLDIFDPFV